MKHYQCFLRRHSDGGRVLIMKISFIVIGVFGFLVFISFVIACVGIEIQFGKRIEQKGPKMVIPDWIHQKEVEFVSGKNKLKAINEQISNFAQTYPTNLKASSNEALLFMRRYRFANCSCFSCCFKDAYPSSNVQ